MNLSSDCAGLFIRWHRTFQTWILVLQEKEWELHFHKLSQYSTFLTSVTAKYLNDSFKEKAPFAHWFRQTIGFCLIIQKQQIKKRRDEYDPPCVHVCFSSVHPVVMRMINLLFWYVFIGYSDRWIQFWLLSAGSSKASRGYEITKKSIYCTARIVPTWKPPDFVKFKLRVST